MITIDAHHHFWQVERSDYGWMENNTAIADIHRDFLPVDFDAAREACAVSQTVSVQATPGVEETDFCLIWPIKRHTSPQWWGGSDSMTRHRARSSIDWQNKIPSLL